MIGEGARRGMRREENGEGALGIHHPGRDIHEAGRRGMEREGQGAEVLKMRLEFCSAQTEGLTRPVLFSETSFANENCGANLSSAVPSRSTYYLPSPRLTLSDFFKIHLHQQPPTPFHLL